MTVLASVVVVGCGLFLIGLAGVILAKPPLAERFLLSFASSARTHYLEQALRLLIGASLLVLSPAMWQSSLFRLVGWALVSTSVALILLPWRWHQKFANRVLPTVVRYMTLYGVALAGFGALLLYGVFAGNGAA